VLQPEEAGRFIGRQWYKDMLFYVLRSERERKRMCLQPCYAVALPSEEHIHLTLRTAEETNVPYNLINYALNVLKSSCVFCRYAS